MARRIEVEDELYTIEAEWEQRCPDDCGFMIEPGDLITPTDDGWVLAEHPEGED